MTSSGERVRISTGRLRLSGFYAFGLTKALVNQLKPTCSWGNFV